MGIINLLLFICLLEMVASGNEKNLLPEDKNGFGLLSWYSKHDRVYLDNNGELWLLLPFQYDTEGQVYSGERNLLTRTPNFIENGTVTVGESTRPKSKVRLDEFGYLWIKFPYHFYPDANQAPISERKQVDNYQAKPIKPHHLIGHGFIRWNGNQKIYGYLIDDGTMRLVNPPSNI
ncbi:Protein of unknown function [Cotesia congregata]|uniref:Uncharacterized protein n=1 Tax=Cotesia congregata TaxID=51543 RepID=A0A8J2HFG0_COTCN|nr:Protein of unknown function [Cotesia congregata]